MFCVRAENEKSRRVRAAASPLSERMTNGSSPIVDPETVAVVAFTGCYAVLVRGKSVRRHLYLSLPAAERAVRRAPARGDLADLVLVELMPV